MNAVGVTIVRRIGWMIPLLFLVSFLTFGLSRLAGGNYFDQFKSDRRYDPAQIRRWEREAGLDLPAWRQFVRWLRGVCFDLRFEAPRRELEGFEAALVEARDYRASPGLRVLRSGDPVVKGLRALRVVGASEDGDLRFPMRPHRADWMLELSVHSRTPLEFSVLDDTGTLLARKSLPVGSWSTVEFTTRSATLTIPVVAGADFCIDHLCEVGNCRKLSLGVPDFGRSFYYDTPVFDLLAANLFNSSLLAGFSLLVTFLVAVPLGTWCAVHHRSVGDRLCSILTFVGMSVPGFFLALLLLFIAVEWINPQFADAPIPIGLDRSGDHAQLGLGAGILDRLRHLCLPVVVLSAGSLAVIQRVTRANLLETLRSSYVTTARAKGLPESRVVYTHALRNALHPLVTIFGYRLAELLSGAALVEIVFQYPGMGRLVLQATISRDLYVVTAAVFVGALVLSIANLAADLLLCAIDPRSSRPEGTGA